jgi:hypothetical protein
MSEGHWFGAQELGELGGTFSRPASEGTAWLSKTIVGPKERVERARGVP